MKLGVLSDTHIPDSFNALPRSVTRELKKVDLIIHAGDFTSREYYEELKKFKPLKAVLGNLDTAELRKYLNVSETFTLATYKIGIVHGSGHPKGVLDIVKKTFDNTFDLIIFGHTHQAFCEKIGKTLFFNPGSPTDKIFAAFNSFGIIELNDTINPKIIKL